MEEHVVVRRGHEKSLLRHHPWLFSGALTGSDAGPGGEPGRTVRLHSHAGRFLGRGAFSPASQIRVRMWSFAEDCPIDAAFFERKLVNAIEYRRQLAIFTTADSGRLVNGEGDGLPGLIVDRYGPVLVVQLLSAGVEYWREVIVDCLVRLFPDCSIYERSDSDARKLEGLSKRCGPLAGQVPPHVTIREGPCTFLVDVHAGHKTGFYLDQRVNREIVAGIANGLTMLNCFSYSGGFGIYALKAGAASVTNIDSSGAVLALGDENARLNDIDANRWSSIRGDVFTALRDAGMSSRRFGLIVLDPPKFAAGKHDIDKAARGYKDINRLALSLLSPGGTLVTFTCSGHIHADLFQKIVADAALDAAREARIRQILRQSPDHPWTLAFPEGLYLKGLVIEVV